MESPLIIPDSKPSTSKGKVKIGLAAALAVILYGFILIFVKIMQIRRKRMEEMLAMVMKTEQMVDDLHALDQNFAAQLQQFNEFYTDY